MKKTFLLLVAVAGLACTPHKKKAVALIKIDIHWLDSIKAKSDTSWTKRYRNSEFVTAEYYIDKKDSIVTQLMKDSAATIRQVSIAKYDQVRLFFAEYYANGQLKAKLPLDSLGRYEGDGVFYYEDGQFKSQGRFNHGLFAGEWLNYNSHGKLTGKDVYDENGQLVRSTKAE